MPRRPDVIIEDRVLIAKDSKLLSNAFLRERYEFDLFNEDACYKCSKRQFRPTDDCMACPQNLGRYTFMREETSKSGRKYHSLPLSDIAYVKQALSEASRDFKTDNRLTRHVYPMRRPIKFTGKLYKKGDVDDKGSPLTDQVTITAEWLKHKRGIIEAQPRAGKTVMATFLTCALGARTIIIAHQFELLDQFYNTFVRDTDMKPGQVEIVKSLAALKKSKADVVLVNPQKFYRQMKKVRPLLRKFSLVVVDEVHTAAAKIYAQVVGNIPAIYRLGLSATPDRKDSRSKLNSFLVGPVVAKAKGVTLRPTVEHYQVKAYPRVDYKLWSSAIGWMADSEERNAEIVANVFEDLENGHHSIIIPVNYKRHMETLVNMINARARQELDFRGNLAVGLHAKAKRKEVLARADDATKKKPCVLVAIMSIIKQGITLRSPTMLHAVMPMAGNPAVGAPMARQCFYRVCTPVAGKQQPVVRLYLDNVTMFRNAARSLVFHEIVPRSKGVNALYDLPPTELAAIKTVLAKPVQAKTRSGRAPMIRGGSILQAGGLWA